MFIPFLQNLGEFTAFEIYASATFGRNWLTSSIGVRMGQTEDQITLIFIRNQAKMSLYFTAEVAACHWPVE